VLAHGLVSSELDLKAWQLPQLAARWPGEFPVLFDSAATGPLGRWSILAAFPRERLIAGPHDGSFLETLELAWQAERRKPVQLPASTAQLPFRGGWVVYLSYEIAAEVEPGLRLPATRGGQPRAVALRVPAAILFDHQQQRCFAIAEAAAAGCIANLRQRAAAVRQTAATGKAVPGVDLGRLHEAPPEEFRKAVLAAQQYIRAGDIYQANLSRCWQLPVTATVSGATLYGALCAANPAPFAAWAQFEGLQIFSSSPERLVQVTGKEIATRPIAGTRPRRNDATAELAELLASPKERAEHVMLIDLERSDLGRVCEAGSVTVDEFMVTETYTHVHHIVSGVRGRLLPDQTPVDVLRALFPGGTITGCPKYRCMEIIAELEAAPRGAYTGSLGYINHDGSMDFNILIRTLTLCDGWLEFRAGAGIVADSDWEQELAETRAKAQGMLRALGVAQSAVTAASAQGVMR
jgi:anthranilate synthase component 1